MCLTSLIGIREKCSDTSSPTYFINDLPGISNAFLSKVTTQEDQSFFDFFDKQVSFAENELKNIIRTQLRPKIKADSLVDVGSVAKFKNYETKTLSGDLDGLRIQLGRSDYFKLMIHELRVHTTNTDTINLYLYDLAQGKQLETTTITGVANEIVTTEVNWSVTNKSGYRDLFLGHDHSSYYKAVTKGGCSSCNGYRIRTGSVKDIRIHQRSITGTKIVDNLSVLTAAPLDLSYSLRCDMDEFICQTRDMWGLAMLYLTGKKIVENARYENTRFNHLITLEADLEALMDKFDNDFKMNLSEGLNNIRVPKDVCFECANPTKMMVNLP